MAEQDETPIPKTYIFGLDMILFVVANVEALEDVEHFVVGFFVPHWDHPYHIPFLLSEFDSLILISFSVDF